MFAGNTRSDPNRNKARPSSKHWVLNVLETLIRLYFAPRHAVHHAQDNAEHRVTRPTSRCGNDIYFVLKMPLMTAFAYGDKMSIMRTRGARAPFGDSLRPSDWLR